MPGANYIVFKNLRPPVCIDEGGQSPLRGKRAQQVFKLADGTYQDKNGFRITKEAIVKNYTDDARLVDIAWNSRHHVTPSAFNNTNHKYYKQLFDKPFRNKEIIGHVPRRQPDPYEDNELKGTRFPDWSKCAAERDVYGELGWIPNFNVKLSKNNKARHTSGREYFDTPMNYHNAFTCATVSNNEFVKENAPEKSMAKGGSAMGGNSPAMNSTGTSFYNTRRSLNPHERVSFSAMRSATSIFSKTQHQFVLNQDTNNQYRYEGVMQRTVEMPNSIPWLRDVRNTDNHNWHKSKASGDNVFAQVPMSATQARTQLAMDGRPVRRAKSRELAGRKKRELAWNGYELPISKFNEGVHSSNRIPFERI